MAICRSLGDHYIKENEKGFTSDPSLSPVYEILPGDMIILASDGLWDVISGKYAMELALTDQLQNAQDVANKLVSTILPSQKCQDNITVIAIRI